MSATNEHRGPDKPESLDVSDSVAVVRIDKDIPLPVRAHPDDAGVDLCSAADLTLEPGERALVPTGIAIALQPRTVGLIHPRSGLAAKAGLSVVNTPGTIDSGYRGEIKVCLINHDMRQPIVIKRGDRIAQLIVQKVELPEFVEISSFDEAGLAQTVRGSGGYGSSGGHARLEKGNS
ncbi:MAG: dUTP diphosphatase [Mycobacteriaceae bacterium]